MSTATAAPGQRQKQWDTRRTEKRRRLDAVRHYASGPVLQQGDMVAVLEALLAPGDRVVLEGNNQKQADFLARMLTQVNPDKIHHLHLIMPSVSLPEHLDLFERGIARKLDFRLPARKAAHRPVPCRMACWSWRHTHLHRAVCAPLVDLTPNVVMVAGLHGRPPGHLYTGPST